MIDTCTYDYTGSTGSGADSTFFDGVCAFVFVCKQASVTFLPILQEPCTFDLLVYTDKTASVPQTWENSDPKFISDSTEVCVCVCCVLK